MPFQIQTTKSKKIMDMLLPASKKSKEPDPEEWILDTGATTHFVNNMKWFEEFMPLPPYIRPAFQRKIQASHPGVNLPFVGAGTCRIHLVTSPGKTISVLLEKVVFAPNAAQNILSLSSLVQQYNLLGDIKAKSITIKEQDGTIITKAKKKQGLYHVELASRPVPIVSKRQMEKLFNKNKNKLARQRAKQQRLGMVGHRQRPGGHGQCPPGHNHGVAGRPQGMAGQRPGGHSQCPAGCNHGVAGRPQNMAGHHHGTKGLPQNIGRVGSGRPGGT